MKRKEFLRYVGTAFGLIAITPILTACDGGSSDSNPPISTPTPEIPPIVSPTPPTTPPNPTPPNTTLSAEEIAGLKFMREEEKLAHDVYVALYGIWGDNIFNQISFSEQTHTEAILSLLTKYGIEDPVGSNPAGIFTDPALQTLYDTLMTMGKSSQIAAASVGALIEETDIRDIQAKKLLTDEADILTVYNSLLCGSQNHLRSFNSKLLNLGITYSPQVITQTEWDAIVNSPGICISL